MDSNINKKKLKEFSYLLGIGFPLFIGLIIPFITGHQFRFWTLYIGVTALLLGIINPLLLHYPYKFWMKLGHILGWINSRLILGIVFVFVLQPIAFLMKFTGYDPLRKKIKKSIVSYREYNNRKVDLTRIF